MTAFDNDEALSRPCEGRRDRSAEDSRAKDLRRTHFLYAKFGNRVYHRSALLWQNCSWFFAMDGNDFEAGAHASGGACGALPIPFETNSERRKG